jgi:sortase A
LAKPGALVSLVGSKWFERCLIVSGISLLGFAGGARLTGELQKRQDLRRFDAALLAAVSSPALASGSGGVPSGIDTSLWSPERIKAYQESLRKDFGAPLAVLSIPKIGLSVPVLEGTDELTLNRAVGLIEGTARPGTGGNVGIAGHRDGYFRGLKDVGAGDEIEMRTLSARDLYVVESVRIVSPDDVHVLDPTASPALTLVTCYPFYFVGSAPQRWIVRAVRRDALPSTKPAGTTSDVSLSEFRKEADSAVKEP